MIRDSEEKMITLIWQIQTLIAMRRMKKRLIREQCGKDRILYSDLALG